MIIIIKVEIFLHHSMEKNFKNYVDDDFLNFNINLNNIPQPNAIFTTKSEEI